MDKLKFCPFCGSEAEIHEVLYEHPKLSLYWARCNNCSAEIKNPSMTMSEAISKWNIRANDLSVTPTAEWPGDDMKSFLKRLNAEEFITFIHDLCFDWDGYRFADGLATLLNEIRSYTAYYLISERTNDN